MEIKVLAAESLGVRSMAVLVRTPDVSFLIDPGAALGPKRYGLPPDELEWRRLRSLKREIRDLLQHEAQLVVITHYHYDHYDPEWARDLRGKRVFLKDPHRAINRNQSKRAKELLKRLAAQGALWHVAEGRRELFGGTEIVFSPPLNHGPEERFGAVVSVAVKSGGRVFLHTSDVSGPVQEEALHFIYQHEPQIILVDGPGTYLGPRFGLEASELARSNLVRLVEDLCPEYLLLDHHLLRDLNWRRWAEPIFEAGFKKGTRVLCGAEFMGCEPLLLEAERRDRYKNHSKTVDTRLIPG